MKTRTIFSFAVMLMAFGLISSVQAADEPKSRIVEEGGQGPFKAIMKEEPTLAEHTVFVPQDLSKFNEQKSAACARLGQRCLHQLALGAL